MLLRRHKREREASPLPEKAVEKTTENVVKKQQPKQVVRRKAKKDE